MKQNSFSNLLLLIIKICKFKVALFFDLKMKCRLLDFTDDEVRQNHQKIFKDLVLASLEQLVLKKAVKPAGVL